MSHPTCTDDGRRLLESAAEDLLAACEEVLRNCELFRRADNMAGRLCRIVEPAIAKAKGE